MNAWLHPRLSFLAAAANHCLPCVVIGKRLPHPCHTEVGTLRSDHGDQPVLMGDLGDFAIQRSNATQIRGCKLHTLGEGKVRQSKKVLPQPLFAEQRAQGAAEIRTYDNFATDLRDSSIIGEFNKIHRHTCTRWRQIISPNL